jgi:hypothetical protein
MKDFTLLEHPDLQNIKILYFLVIFAFLVPNFEPSLDTKTQFNPGPFSGLDPKYRVNNRKYVIRLFKNVRTVYRVELDRFFISTVMARVAW